MPIEVFKPIEVFNTAPEADVRAALSSCLAVPRFVDEVISARPYADVAALLGCAKASAENLTDPELAAALSHHPRISERAAGPDADEAFSASEQSGVRLDNDTTRRLRAGNAAYEQRFGRVFLIRAAGRSTEEILAELDRRLGNDDETERREVVTALRDIGLLRLTQVIGSSPE